MTLFNKFLIHESRELFKTQYSISILDILSEEKRKNGNVYSRDLVLVQAIGFRSQAERKRAGELHLHIYSVQTRQKDRIVYNKIYNRLKQWISDLRLASLSVSGLISVTHRLLFVIDQCLNIGSINPK